MKLKKNPQRQIIMQSINDALKQVNVSGKIDII